MDAAAMRRSNNTDTFDLPGQIMLTQSNNTPHNVGHLQLTKLLQLTASVINGQRTVTDVDGTVREARPFVRRWDRAPGHSDIHRWQR